MTDKLIGSGQQEFLERISSLEDRIARIESVLGKSVDSVVLPEREETAGPPLQVEASEDRIESNIGVYGLAWLGNIVLFFGIGFLAEYFRSGGFHMISVVLGYLSVAGLFYLSRYFRISNSYMSRLFNMNGYLLLYFLTLKLHFLTANPVLTGKATGLFLLLAVNAVLLYIVFRQKNPVMAGLSLTLMAVSAVMSDSTFPMLSIALLISILSVIFLYRFGWIYQIFLSITLVYTLSLLWLIGNPFMNHPVQIVSSYLAGFNYLFMVSAIFSLIALMPAREDSYQSDSIIGSIIYNGIGFVIIMTLYILSFFKDNYILPAASISLYCLIYSVILKIRTNWKVTGGIYALFGFVAMSLAIIGIYHFPGAWFLLSVQSLLVVSMAVWFKSRFIVVMNSMMYLMLLCLYLLTSKSVDLVNIAFSLAAFATARILNWQKERLTIRTDFIRNMYLIILFFMVLYTLYHILPRHYVTLSWIIAALVYFLMSLALKNVKYRYMALGTLISAAVFLFLIDLVRIELAFRVISLLLFAIISLGLSFFYFNRSKKLKR